MTLTEIRILKEGKRIYFFLSSIYRPNQKWCSQQRPGPKWCSQLGPDTKWCSQHWPDLKWCSQLRPDPNDAANTALPTILNDAANTPTILYGCSKQPRHFSLVQLQELFTCSTTKAFYLFHYKSFLLVPLQKLFTCSTTKAFYLFHYKSFLLVLLQELFTCSAPRAFYLFSYKSS